jgi:uncharacterized protein YutE (UPF0331/DUF86 family)
MTAGPIDLKVVGDRIGVARRCVDDLQRIPSADLTTFVGDFRNAATAESLLRRAIEALLDTARHLLSKRHGLAALEYREVARRAGEKGLIEDPGLQQRFVQIAGFRNRLTPFYDEVTPQELFGILTGELSDLRRIADQLSSAAARLAAKP